MNLADLKRRTQELGLEVTKSGKREAKRDYLLALRSHKLKEDYPSGLPYDELSPMLCFSYWDLHPKEQEALWSDNNGWIAQEKLNGCRLILHFVSGLGVFAHSRTTNKSDFRRTELSEHLPFHGFVPTFTATVDCEAILRDLPTTSALFHMNPKEARQVQRENERLAFHIFDITNWQGADLRPGKLKERLEYLVEFQRAIQAEKIVQYFHFPATCLTNKKSLYSGLMAAGGEGIILKNLGSNYIDSTTRNRQAWVKVKRQVELDAFVTGFERGKLDSLLSEKVACLLFSVKTDAGARLIAKISNLPWEFRKRISHWNPATNEVTMSADIYHRCARIAGLELSNKSFRLVNPRIESWRPDLKETDCLYKMEDLQALRMGKTHISPLRVAATPVQVNLAY